MKFIIIADEQGLLECKKSMPKRITNLYKISQEKLKTIYNNNFCDDVLIIFKNLNKCLDNRELCNTLILNNIDIVCLKNKKQKQEFNKELMKLYTLISKNTEIYYKMISHVTKNNSITNYRKLVDV